MCYAAQDALTLLQSLTALQQYGLSYGDEKLKPCSHALLECVLLAHEEHVASGLGAQVDRAVKAWLATWSYWAILPPWREDHFARLLDWQRSEKAHWGPLSTLFGKINRTTLLFGSQDQLTYRDEWLALMEANTALTEVEKQLLHRFYGLFMTVELFDAAPCAPSLVADIDATAVLLPLPPASLEYSDETDWLKTWRKAIVASKEVFKETADRQHLSAYCAAERPLMTAAMVWLSAWNGGPANGEEKIKFVASILKFRFDHPPSLEFLVDYLARDAHLSVQEAHLFLDMLRGHSRFNETFVTKAKERWQTPTKDTIPAMVTLLCTLALRTQEHMVALSVLKQVTTKSKRHVRTLTPRAMQSVMALAQYLERDGGLTTTSFLLPYLLRAPPKTEEKGTSVPLLWQKEHADLVFATMVHVCLQVKEEAQQEKQQEDYQKENVLIKVVRNGMLSFVVHQLLSEAPEEAEKVFSLYHATLKEASFPFQRQLLLAADAFARGFRQRPKGAQLVTTFYAAFNEILVEPAHPIYPLVNELILAMRDLDFTDIPLFYTLLFSDRHRTWIQELQWLITHLAAHEWSDADAMVLRRRHVLPLLAARLVHSTRFKMHEQALLRVIQHASALESSQVLFPMEALNMMLKTRHFFKEDVST